MDQNNNILYKYPEKIIKRDGSLVVFEIEKIENAIKKCFAGIKEQPIISVIELAKQVVNILSTKSEVPTVEKVQDVVETVLQAAGEFDAAKHYILYRAEHAKIREEKPIPEQIKQSFQLADQYFGTQLQKFQFYDKYARFNYDLGRRETWIETVNRSVSFLKELSNSKLPESDYERIRKSILEMKSAPSMRLLAMAGGAAKRSNVCIYNCSYLPVDSVDSFVEALIISMNGCGVGFSVESKYVENLPRIRRQTQSLAMTYVVEDSSEGWADAVRLGLGTWIDGGDMKFDYSLIRPGGSILKTKGGRASGPAPLRKMLEFAKRRILARQGSFLRPIDAHDIMCEIGNAAVAGGVRRTAMISLFDWDDAEMRLCKSGDFERENSQRWNANNSAVWPDRGITQSELVHQMLDMADGGRGEPGIFNRQSAINMRPARREMAEFGTNPCITADAWVMTDKGARRVTDLIENDFIAIVDGKQYPAKRFWETGVKQILKLKTKEGYVLRLTSNHKILTVTNLSRKTEKTKWTEAGSLKVGDLIKIHNHHNFSWTGDGSFGEGWLLGSLVGDGTFDNKTAKLEYWGENRKKMAEFARNLIKENVKSRADLMGHDQTDLDRMTVQSTGLRDLAADYGIYKGMKTVTDIIEESSSDFYRGFLRGLFDADGTVVGTQTKGVSVRLAQSNLSTLEAVQRMMLRLGIASTIYKNRRPAGLRLLPDGHGGSAEYSCQADHELVVSEDNLKTFAELIGFFDENKTKRLQTKLKEYKRDMNRERFVARIESIEMDGQEMVYDCEVKDKHAFDANGLVVHNCGEIILRPYQFCNLSIAIARQEDTYETLKDKVEVAAMIGTIQSMGTNFPGLRPIWQKNCQEERLLGVDITGQMDSPAAQDPAIQNRLRQVAIETNRKYAELLGINQSTAVTCVKPSGNSSQLFNCASGLHSRWSPFYIRNVRLDAHSSVYKVLDSAGVPMDPENGQTTANATTWVAHFPVATPAGAITRKQRDAIEQCEYWLQNKLHWTEHNPSVTITYYPDELLNLIKWVWEHRDMIGGMSFLPAFDANYAQMPYQEITKEEYKVLADKFPNIDFSKLYRYEEEDYTKAAQELACVAGACEIEVVPTGTNGDTVLATGVN